jgi:transposase
MNYNTKYVVRLTEEEREQLVTVVRRGKVAAAKRRRAQLLLKADAGSEGSGRTDQEISEALEVSVGLVHDVRQAYVEQGLSASLEPKPKSRHRPRKLDGEQEARLIALACGPAPEGRARWTLRLLADQLVELEIVEAIGKDAVRSVLKKTSLSPG